MKKPIIFLLLLTGIKYFSQEEIIINTVQDYTQSEPAIEIIDSEENIAIVWRSENQVDSDSEGDIFIRFFDSSLNPSGSEILVNEISNGPQIYPQIASNKHGSFVVVWASFDRDYAERFYDIKAKLFSNLNAITFEFTVNSYIEDSQTRPQVSMNDKGESIVVWESWFQDGSDRGIYAQRFDPYGNKIGEEFQVNYSTEFSQCRPNIEFLENNGFIVTWESWNNSSLDYDIYAKIYDENGNIVKDEFVVNNYTNNNQWFSDILIKKDNSFDIVWCSWEQDGYDGGIFLRSFDNNFQPVESEIQVNSSTEFYQWLPKIYPIDGENKTVMWSSWNIDGSREGVYYKSLTKSNKEYSLEKRLNVNTESYQWEPDFVTLSNNKIIGTWSSWGNLNKDYEIIARKADPSFLIGIIDGDSYQHTSGTSTTNFIVHVVDSTSLKGHLYEITFKTYDQNYLSYAIEDKNISEFKVSDSPLNRGSNVQYLTEEFDGIIVEIIPNFKLDIDQANSKFINNSGSNIIFYLENPVIYPRIAPVDVIIVWGNPDTLEDGSFSVPLDTAMSPSAIKEIALPFYAETYLEKERLGSVVFENAGTQNKRWDPGETVVILTPKQYKENDFSTHVQLFSTVESENLIWPNEGDTNFIATIKPITTEDIYQFTTENEDIILELDKLHISNTFKLYQNYPNPFNPSTVIRYQIPSTVDEMREVEVNTERIQSMLNVSLKIYDILGREIITLVNQIQKPGNYEVLLDASNLSSGIYFYKLQYWDYQQVKKMLLLK